MGRLLTLALALLTVLGTIAITAGTANAAEDHRPCVTRGEFAAVHRGMTKARVQQIWDGPGRVAEGGRYYRACGGGFAGVDYSFTAHNVVLGKWRAAP